MQGTPKTVLIVDDNRDHADTLAILVRCKGHVSLVAYDADSAFELAQRVVPEIIFHDIGLPFVDGYAAARRLRNDAKFASTLLVALTAYNRTSDRQCAMSAGYNLHLCKPIDGDALDQILNSPVRRV